MMNSVCVSNCLTDALDPHIPVRATYMNLYKWPESDAEFVRSSVIGRSTTNAPTMTSRHGGYGHSHARVVDSISCRQMYLRSYKFSRKESVSEKTHKCFKKVKERVAAAAAHGKGSGRAHHHGGGGGRRRRKCWFWRRVKGTSCAALVRILHRFLSCGASVVVQSKH